MNDAAARRVVRVRAWTCPAPLRMPVRLGPIEYTTREYAVLALTTDDGQVGRALGYTRGTPILPSLRPLAAALAEMDCSDPTAVQDQLSRRYMPGWPQLIRAASLIDIALWDIAAKAAGRPLHRLLGATTDDAPVMAVTGYFADQRAPEELVAEAEEVMRMGILGTKLILGGHDAEADERLTSYMREALGAEASIGIDFHAPWRDVDAAESHCRPLLAHHPRFIEDPFPSTSWRLLRGLARRLDEVPLAAGEDTCSLAGFEELLEGARYLRCDATASGGVTGFLAAAEVAATRGAQVVPHVFPYIHAPLCAAVEVVANAEIIVPSTGADPWDALVDEQWPLRDGKWRLTDEPGLELRLDLEKVAALATETLDLQVAGKES